MNALHKLGWEAAARQAESQRDAALDECARLRSLNAELVSALERLTRDCDGDALGTVKAPRWPIVCEASAALAKAREGKS